MFRTLPEAYKVVQGIQPRTTNGGFTGSYVSLKNALKVWIVVNLTQAVGHATTLTPTQASAVAGTGAKALTNNVNIWANEDTAASDTLVKQTSAKNYSVTADVKNKQVIFEIDPHGLDVANDFDCITLVCADSSQATNIASVTYFIEQKYKEDVPPSAIAN
jgi:hypothetical protein